MLHANNAVPALRQLPAKDALPAGKIQNSQRHLVFSRFISLQHPQYARQHDLLVIFAAFITDEAVIPIGYVIPMRGLARCAGCGSRLAKGFVRMCRSFHVGDDSRSSMAGQWFSSRMLREYNPAMSTMPIVILAGGRSTRMGADKAMLPVAGVPMIHRIAETALEASSRLVIVGREKPADWPEHLPATFMVDSTDTGGGPISGLITALESLEEPLVLLGCDMPLLTPDTILLLIAAHRPPHVATIAIATSDKGFPQAEPLLALYTPSVLPELDVMQASGRRSLQPLIHRPEVLMWPVPATHQHELLNVNDPETLAQAEARLAAQRET